MNIIAISQARMGSTRLPGKVLKEVEQVPLLEMHIRRILRSKYINGYVLAIPDKPQDDPIAGLGRKLSVLTYRGNEQDVLDRYYQASALYPAADYIIRVTADCPLVDPWLLDEIIDYTRAKQLDYCSNTLAPSFPDGMDVEIFTPAALSKAWHEASLPSDREHVTPYIWRNSSFKKGTLFTSDNFSCRGGNYSDVRLTVDAEDDYRVVSELVKMIGWQAPWQQYATAYRQSNMHLINAYHDRNEGYLKSLNDEK